MEETAVRELKKRFRISDWLARRMLQLYDGHVETAAKRLTTEDLTALESRERELSKGWKEKPENFRASGRRDGMEAARHELKKGQVFWQAAKHAEPMQICTGCAKVTPASRPLLKRLVPTCLCFKPRIPVKSDECLVPQETLGYQEGYNAVMADHIRKTIHAKFPAGDSGREGPQGG